MAKYFSPVDNLRSHLLAMMELAPLEFTWNSRIQIQIMILRRLGPIFWLSIVCCLLFAPLRGLDEFATKLWYPCMTEAAGHCLDLLDTLHNRDQTGIQTATVELLASEYAGVGTSPLWLLTIVAGYLRLRRATWVRSMWMLLAAVFVSPWVSIGTAVFAAVLAIRWPTAANQFMLYAFAALLTFLLAWTIVVTQRFIRFLISPIVVDATSMLPAIDWWNRHVSKIDIPPAAFDDDAPAVELQRSQSSFAMLPHYWFHTRWWPAAFWGLPMFVTLATSAFAILTWPLNDLGPMYMASATRAMDSHAWHAADTYFRRVLRWDPGHDGALLGRARVAEERGDIQQAQEFMERNAPLEQGGNAAAHWWLAERLSKQKVIDGKEFLAMKQHLEHVVAIEPKHFEAHRMLAAVYRRSQQPKLAVPHLLAIVDQQADLAFPLAEIYYSLGQSTEAQTQLTRASQRFQEMSDQEPQQIEHVLYWAQAELLLRRYESADTILAQGSQRHTDPRFAVMFGALYRAQAEDQMQSNPGDLQAPLQFLRRALDLDPQGLPTLRSLAAIAYQHPDAKPTVRTWLKIIVQQPNSESAEAHFVLGNLATLDEDFDLASQHYQRAMELAPERVELLNNLAWSLGHSKPPQLQRAIELSTQALERGTSNPSFLTEFRVTHGLLMVMQGDWTEAIAQLELVLPVVSDRPHVREGLATAYGALGMQQIADEHRRLATTPTNDSPSTP